MGTRNGYYYETDYGMLYRVKNGTVVFSSMDLGDLVLPSQVSAYGVTEENGFTFLCDLEGNRG